MMLFNEDALRGVTEVLLPDGEWHKLYRSFSVVGTPKVEAVLPIKEASGAIVGYRMITSRDGFPAEVVVQTAALLAVRKG